MRKKWGKKTWCFPGGFIPIESSGSEPEFLSNDEIQILNASKEDAHVHITIYYTDKDPVPGYELTVKAERVRQFRVNDLIDPHAIPFGVAYGAVIESDVPIVVQLAKQITSSDKLAIMGTIAFPID